MATRKPILCLDFDGVIHSYTSPWINQWTIPDPPVAGAFDFLDQASRHFEIVIYSSRSKTTAGIMAMQDWLEKHLKQYNGGVPPPWYDKLSFADQKPPAFLTIDDRCLCFEGTWPDPATLKQFKPWNKRNDKGD